MKYVGISDIEDCIKENGYIRVKCNIDFESKSESQKLWKSIGNKGEPYEDLCAMAFFRYFPKTDEIESEKPMVDLCSSFEFPGSVDDSNWKPSAKENLIRHIQQDAMTHLKSICKSHNL